MCFRPLFNLADEACEDALYDLPAFREFCWIDLGRERVPDATSLLNFRHLWEAHDFGAALLSKVGELLQQNGLKLSGGTIVCRCDHHRPHLFLKRRQKSW